ncbi:MAG: glycosyltransferase [Desulfitobacteriaceae bacterium]
MKVLQVNCVYKRGSTGKIVDDIHIVLKERGYKSIICYGRGQKEKELGVYKTSSEITAKFNNLWSRIIGLQYNGSFFATNKLIRIIKAENPDIVHLHCINGYFVNIYKLVEFLKKSGINTVLTLHAEFMYTGGCGYSILCDKWKSHNACGNCPQLRFATKSLFFDRTHTAWEMMRKAFEGFKENLIVTSVSPWLMERAKQSPILSDKRHYVVLNGIDTSKVFHPCDYEFLKKRHNLTDEKIILHVTASFTNELKGGKYIRELAERLKGENFKIVVVGNTNRSFILPPNIIEVGRTHDQKELAAYYSMADLTVLTSLRETFSMICAETLACGTPVVGFKAGAPEQISLSDYSEFTEHGNLDELEQIVTRWLNKKREVEKQLVLEASELYSKEYMVDNYVKLYENFS